METGADPLINQELGSYRIETLIGVGGMGRVYKAVHKALGRVVAIKVLPPSFAEDPGYIQRFVREAQIAAQLNHPNLIGCYDFGESDWGYFFVMEYVEGVSLADWLIENRRMKLEDAIPIMRQVCKGLLYAHAAGIIHRDIKPDNILWTADGTVKVADLGLAKVEDKSDSGLTQLGMAIGTPNYISPEQVRGEADIDWRSDIYSLGATFYHVVTGRIPYEAKTPSMIMTRHVNDPVPIARQAFAEVSEPFSSLLVRMMQKDPHLRLANCEEVIGELDKILPPTGFPAVTKPASVPTTIEPLPAVVANAARAEKEGLMWIVFGAIVLAAAVLGGGYLIYKSRQPDPILPPQMVRPTPPPKPARTVAPPTGLPDLPESPPSEPVEPPIETPEPIVAMAPTPPVHQPPPPPRSIGVRNPELIKTSEFVGTEAEPVKLNAKPRLTLNSQQHVMLYIDYTALIAEVESHVGHPIELRDFKLKLWVPKCTAVEEVLSVRVHRLKADPQASFQFDRAPLKELDLQPTDRGYWLELDVSDDYELTKQSGKNFGLTLMTSQAGEAIFGTAMLPEQKHWPTADLKFVPAP
jgi:serine/threonine protein kinase